MNQSIAAGREPGFRFRSYIAALVVLLLVVFSFSDGGKRIVNADDRSKVLERADGKSVADSGIKTASTLGNTTVTFQDGVSGYAGTRDTYINHVSPATSRGAENLIIQDKNPSTVPPDERTSLLQFDLSSIPTNSTIVSAQLDFYVDSEGQGFNMYRMKVPWNEATATFASIGSRHFMPEGIDAEIAVSAFWPGVDGYVGPITVTVPPLQISDWVNGVMTNNGWLMVSAHNDDGVQSRSSEHATVANRPKLTVVYNETPPNFAPASPVVVSPPDDATGVSTSPNLAVSVADPNADNLTVTYYGRAVSTTVPGADFTVIAMPDTQHYVDNGGANAANFYAQTQWIVANKDALNIKFVSGLGDIVENGNTFDSEWQIATSAYSTIEDPLTTNLPDGIPYGLAVGNHDQTPNGGGDTASTTKYNQYFGTSRFAGRAYYGGQHGSNNDNHFQLFSGGGMDFIIIHLEYDTTPLPAVLTWADNLLQTHSNRRAIVTTHWMLGMGMPGPFGAQGAAIYNELKDRPNLFMLLGGHVHTEGRRQDTFEGRTVHGILSDYQARTNGGDGWLRIMTFSPANNTISVKTYSPSLLQFETDYDSQFTLNYDMSGSAPFQVIGTNTGVPSGTNTSLNWPGLTAGTEYEWYATVSDGTLTTTGPVWSFTTGPAATPTNTATATATDTPTPTNTPTNTPTPCSSPGSLDTSFGIDGKVITAFSSDTDWATAVAVQSDAKIVVAGYVNGAGTGSGGEDFGLVRYNVDGSLDTSFHGDGKVTTPIGTNTGDVAYAVAIQPDGRIVAAGRSYDNSFQCAVVRYNADGTLDTSFGGDGKVTTSLGSLAAYSVAIQPDGKIVVAGQSDPSDFLVVRFNTDGSLDTSFDDDGIVTTQVGSSLAYSIAIQPDGKIIAAGVIDGAFGIIRYNSNGSLDTSFGGDGIITTPVAPSSTAHSVAIQSDDKIVVAGITETTGDSDIAVVRYNSNGSLDTSFDGDGEVITPVGSGDDRAFSVAIRPDGRIVVAGYSENGSNQDIAIVQYNINRSLDTSFDLDGMVTTPIGNNNDVAASVAIQNDGKVVAAGYRYIVPDYDFAVVRYNGALCGTPTPTDTPTNTPTDTPTNTPTPPAVISGTVTYANAIGAPNPRFVSNVVMSGVGSPGVSGTTDFPGGNYSLTGFGSGSYTVTPSKAGVADGSVSSFDAARIAQFVVGLATFSPVQQTVAEVSGNGTVSAFDASLVAAYSVGHDGGSTGNWRFSPVSRTYASITTDISGENYLAMLMGEVSGNWQNTAARPEGSSEKVVGSRWNAEDSGHLSVALGSQLTGEKEIIIPVSVQGVADKGIIAYEFDLRFDPSVIQPQENPVDVVGTVSRGLFALANTDEPGLLRVVVYGPMPIDEDGVLLNLRFMPVGAVSLASALMFERIIFNEGDLQVAVIDGLIELF